MIELKEIGFKDIIYEVSITYNIIYISIYQSLTFINMNQVNNIIE